MKSSIPKSVLIPGVLLLFSGLTILTLDLLYIVEFRYSAATSIGVILIGIGLLSAQPLARSILFPAVFVGYVFCTIQLVSVLPSSRSALDKMTSIFSSLAVAGLLTYISGSLSTRSAKRFFGQNTAEQGAAANP